MFKRSIRPEAMILAIIAALCLLCACAKDGPPFDPDSPGDKIPYPEEPAFKTGIWTARSDGTEDQYYYFYFYEGEMSGRLVSLTYGSGTGFSYDREVPEKAIFHFGAVDDESPCEVTLTGAESMILAFDDCKYDMSYLTGDQDYVWYSNAELEEMALKYYAANNNGYTPGCSGSIINEDGTVSIQLFDRLEDHNSTSAWYTVDRRTAAGTDDMTAEKIDLSAFAENSPSGTE